MSDDTRYHYDEDGNYLGKSTSTPPATAGGGCCGLILLGALCAFGMQTCGDRDSGFSRSSRSYVPASSSSRSATGGVTPGFSLETSSTGALPSVPEPGLEEQAPPASAGLDPAAGCRSIAYAAVEYAADGRIWQCFKRKSMARAYLSDCLSGPGYGPEKRRVSGQRLFCVTATL